MDLQLTEEQRWLAESVDELVGQAGADVWQSLREFGAFDVDDDGLGAVELALIARGLGRGLVPLPYADAAAVHYAVALDGARVVPCLAEPDRPYTPTEPATATIAGGRLTGTKDAVPHAEAAELFAVPAASDNGPVLAVVAASAAVIERLPTLDDTVAPARIRLEGVEPEHIAGDATTIETVASAAAVLAAAEAIGAAGSMLELARVYSGERRQFGRPIAGFQALRHLLADMYVQVESAWSSVLYAAASLDERDAEAARTASIAKAYAARATQDVAHGALQVFGGIAFTAEHPAHRFLRRIVVRGGTYGSARDHERAVARSFTTAPS